MWGYACLTSSSGLGRRIVATGPTAFMSVGSGAAFGLCRQSAGGCSGAVGFLPTRYLVFRLCLPAVEFSGLHCNRVGVADSLGLGLLGQSDFVVHIGFVDSSRSASVVTIR